MIAALRRRLAAALLRPLLWVRLQAADIHLGDLIDERARLADAQVSPAAAPDELAELERRILAAQAMRNGLARRLGAAASFSTTTEPVWKVTP